MNVLITALSSSTSPSGICRHAHNLVHCAVSRRETTQVTLVLGKWQETYFRDLFKLEHPKLKVIPVNIANDAFARNRWYLQELHKIAAYTTADIVHLSFPVPILRRALRCPVVVSLHDLYPYDEPDNFGFPKVFFNRVFLNKCLKEVDSIACVSEATLSGLKMRFPRFAHRKAVVVHNCVTVSSSEVTVPTFESAPFMLMVAEHRANKNILMVFKVFRDLLQKGQVDKHTVLVVVGRQGSETNAIQYFIQREAFEKRIKLIDGICDGELKWLYAHCAVLIAPSSTEGFGLPVIEGLLCGSRVVCSDIPAFREICGSACHYFDLHAESGWSAMSAAICKALAEPTSPPPQLERFSVANIAKQYADLYIRLREDALEMPSR